MAIAFGLAAAVVFATATLCASRSSRLIGQWSLAGWVAVVGLPLVLPPVLAGGVPANLDTAAIRWLVVAGVANVGGLVLAYTALRRGKVGLVAPIVSTEGAIAAAISVLAGQALPFSTAILLTVIAFGIVLASSAPDDRDASPGSTGHGAALYAIAAAAGFGASLYAMGRVGGQLPIAWVLLPARVVGILAVALPLASRGRLRLTRGAAPLVLTSGVCEVLGFALFTLGARRDIAIASVLSSQFSAIAAVFAYLLFGERLTRLQRAGVGAVLGGVAALSVLRA